MFRIEHQTGNEVRILGHTDAPASGQAALSALAMQLIGAGESGELVLVDEQSGEEVARRSLRAMGPDDDPQSGDAH